MTYNTKTCIDIFKKVQMAIMKSIFWHQKLPQFNLGLLLSSLYGLGILIPSHSWMLTQRIRCMTASAQKIASLAHFCCDNFIKHMFLFKINAKKQGVMHWLFFYNLKLVREPKHTLCWRQQNWNVQKQTELFSALYSYTKIFYSSFCSPI